MEITNVDKLKSKIICLHIIERGFGPFRYCSK